MAAKKNSLKYKPTHGRNRKHLYVAGRHVWH
jgi:hypothetical protein